MSFPVPMKTLGEKYALKGFRAGKAPRGVLQGIYGDEVKGQVQSQLVEESLGEVIKERGLADCLPTGDRSQRS